MLRGALVGQIPEDSWASQDLLEPLLNPAHHLFHADILYNSLQCTENEKPRFFLAFNKYNTRRLHKFNEIYDFITCMNTQNVDIPTSSCYPSITEVMDTKSSSQLP